LSVIIKSYLLMNKKVSQHERLIDGKTA